MKRLLLVFIISFLTDAIVTSQNPAPSIVSLKDTIDFGYFTQKLDHTDPSNTKTWLQRYYVNHEYFNKDDRNVAFLYVGGDSAASYVWVEAGSYIESAKKYGALLFELEHRFYGNSLPLRDYSTENLRYLSSEQALNDLARFIKAMNDKYSLAKDVKWIAYGGGYAGSLATWLRLKHPDLVFGAVASSAPLLAKLDFSEYYQTVIQDVDATKEKCVDSIKTGFAQLEEKLTDPNPTENITDIFNMCKPIEAKDLDNDDARTLTHSIIDVFSDVAIYELILINVRMVDLCRIMTDKYEGKEMYRLARTVDYVYGSRGLDKCTDSNYRDYIQPFKNITADENKRKRQWLYQTCTEFGWFQTSTTKDKVFGEGYSVEYFSNICTEVFGPEFNASFTTERIELTNAKYGGLDINVTNVVFVHGDRDPWHPVGLFKENTPESPVIIMKGISHCANMYDELRNEWPEVASAKKQVDVLVGTWLGFV